MKFTIGKKIVTLAVLACLIPVIVITAYSVHSVTATSLETIGVQLRDTAAMVGENIDVYFDQREDDAKVISQANVLESENPDEQRGYFDDVLDANDSIVDIMVVMADGKVFSTAGTQEEVNKPLSEVEPGLVPLFELVLKSKQGDVVFEKAHLKDSKLSMSMLTPITDDTNTVVISVLVLEINMKPVQDMISEFNENVIGDEAVYLLNDDGEVIFSEDTTQTPFDTFNDLKVNEHVLDATEEDGSKAHEIYVNSRGIEVMAGMADMRAHGTNEALDWGIVALAETSAIAAPVYSLRNKIILIAFIIFVLVVVGAVLFSNTLSKPLVATAEMVTVAAEKGDFSRTVKYESDDEIGAVVSAFKKLSDLQNTQAGIAKAIADGDLSITPTAASDKDILGNAFVAMTKKLNEVVRLIYNSAEEVNSGSQQISQSSQALSSGATTSAASIEEISSSMSEIESQARGNADNAQQASQLASSALDVAGTGTEEMKSMLEAMTGISESSQQIAKIIKVIDDIAFQTNLLALNAAVEAARAGVHGKGFAVVAEEVRSLAGRSAKAARETAELIEDAVKRVENGNNIAQKTGDALSGIVDQVTKATNLVGEISSASNEQAQGISQVSVGLEQIDNVTQSNTASAEETASASHQLLAQASELQNVISHFTLNKESGAKSGKNSNNNVSKPSHKQVALPDSSPQKDSWGTSSDNEQIISLDDNDFGKY